MRWKKLQLKYFFSPSSNSQQQKGSCVWGLPGSFLSSCHSPEQGTGLFSGCHSQHKSLPLPPPPAKIIILFVEAKFCFPKLQIMFKKTEELREKEGEEYLICKTRGILCLPKMRFSRCAAVWMQRFPLSLTLPCPAAPGARMSNCKAGL